jgi:glutathione S-transferase
MAYRPEQDCYIMYGAGFSLYSGKLRSYLLKKAIPFIERAPSIITYKRFIVPRTGVRFIPVLHTPDDEVLQDTTAIIDELEKRYPARSVYPATPRQQLVALLLELYGDEWLLIPAMHYRWNFPEDNQPFIHEQFGAMAFPWLPRALQRVLGKKLGARFQALLPRLGISEQTIPAIEASWQALLADLERHFSAHDFLLGARPSIGDFGLIGPMYAHLYRDPYPGRLMRENAPAVAAWVERMQSEQAASSEFLPVDDIPETLWPVLQRMVREQVPVLQDTEQALAHWVKDQSPGTEVPRSLGEHDFQLDDAHGQRMILPHSLWRWQRPRDYLRALSVSHRNQAMAVAERLGLETALKQEPLVGIKRRHNRFVLAPR